jgi:mannose-6-phosphate isomerase-like protein (cupin superfamily)
MHSISLAQKFSLITDHWRPRVLATLNGQEVKLVKFQGTFPWHHHDEADELFLVWKGSMRIEFSDRVVPLNAGECCLVPKGTTHRTAADEEAEVIIFEPATTRNTGNVTDPYYTAPDGMPI